MGTAGVNPLGQQNLYFWVYLNTLTERTELPKRWGYSGTDHLLVRCDAPDELLW